MEVVACVVINVDEHGYAGVDDGAFLRVKKPEVHLTLPNFQHQDLMNVPAEPKTESPALYVTDLLAREGQDSDVRVGE